MSRTKRHIPYWTKGKDKFALTWQGVDGSDFFKNDPRDTIYHGYDGYSPGYYYLGFNCKGFRENFQYKSRRFYKRRYAKQRRQYMKKDQ